MSACHISHIRVCMNVIINNHNDVNIHIYIYVYYTHVSISMILCIHSTRVRLNMPHPLVTLLSRTVCPHYRSSPQLQAPPKCMSTSPSCSYIPFPSPQAKSGGMRGAIAVVIVIAIAIEPHPRTSLIRAILSS